MLFVEYIIFTNILPLWGPSFAGALRVCLVPQLGNGTAGGGREETSKAA